MSRQEPEEVSAHRYPQLPRLKRELPGIQALAAPPRTELEGKFRRYCEEIGITRFGRARTDEAAGLEWMFLLIYPKWSVRSRRPVLPIAIAWMPNKGQVYIGSTYEVPQRAFVRAPFGSKPGSELYKQLEKLRLPGMNMGTVSSGRRVTIINLAFAIDPYLIPNSTILKSYLDKLYDTASRIKQLFQSRGVGYRIATEGEMIGGLTTS